MILSPFFLKLGFAMNSVFGNLQWLDCQDPVLDLPSCEVNIEEIQHSTMQNLFEAMIRFARGEQSDLQKHVLVGLAAPQIGQRIRVILVDTKADGKGGVGDLHLYINPEIIETSSETNSWYEGCFSTGNVKGIVTRPSWITVKAFDRNGDKVFETHSGYVARIFQHEIDHLNGIRFPDRVSQQDQLHIVKGEEMDAYRNQGEWRNWKMMISQQDWKKHMK
jgi:peptide deformylase